MFAAPAEGTLKDFMEFAETGFADHEQSPPNQRTHATEHYAELINRNRRYGRFRHASSLPKPTRTPSNLTPRNLPLSHMRNAIIPFCNTPDTIPYLAPSGERFSSRSCWGCPRR